MIKRYLLVNKVYDTCRLHLPVLYKEAPVAYNRLIIQGKANKFRDYFFKIILRAADISKL